MSHYSSRIARAAGLVSIIAVLTLAACGDGDQEPATPTATASPGQPLSMAEWGRQVCALSVEAADALDIPNSGNPETLTLEARKQRAAEVLAPRAEALAGTAEALAAIQPPNEVVEYAGTFQDFHTVLQTTMADLAAAWQELVDAAEAAQSAEEIDAANDVFMAADNDVEETLDIHNTWWVSAEMKAALSAPEDCGVLNAQTGSCPNPARPCSLRFPESARA